MWTALLLGLVAGAAPLPAECPDVGTWVRQDGLDTMAQAVGAAPDGTFVADRTSPPRQMPEAPAYDPQPTAHWDDTLTVLAPPDGSVVQAVAADGESWLLGTNSGAFAWNGKDWYRFPRRPAPPALLVDVRAILVDGDTTWFGGTEGLHRKVGEQWTHGGGGVGQDWPAVRSVRALLQASDGSLWVGSAGQGLWALGVQEDGWYPVGPPVAHVWSLAEHDGAIWAGTPRGLYRRGDDGWTRVPGLPDEQIDHLLAHDGRLWVGTPKGLGALTADGFVACTQGDQPFVPTALAGNDTAALAARWGVFRFEAAE